MVNWIPGKRGFIATRTIPGRSANVERHPLFSAAGVVFTLIQFQRI